MKLLLYHCRNVDLMYGQGNGSGYWEPPMDKTRTSVTVPDLLSASTAFREWIVRNHLGGGNIAHGSGNVIDGGRVVARITFNGRVWLPDGTEFTKSSTTPPAPV